MDHAGVRTVRLRHAPASAREARRRVVNDLSARGMGKELVDEVESVVAELVLNAAQHASPCADGLVRLRWLVKSDHVEVEVRDGGGATDPHPHRLSPWATRGRGLRIVRSIAHEWGVQRERGGRVVWASVGGPSRMRRL